LLLIGHGSLAYPDASSTMRRHADRLRQENWFAQVEVAVLNGLPSVHDALARIGARAIRVVPFFMEDGYFNRVAMPQALGIGQLTDGDHTPSARATRTTPTRLAGGTSSVNSPRILICPPVGVHDGMAGLIEHHAAAACTGLGIPSRAAAVLVIGHGSSNDPGRALALQRHTARVAATELFARVEAAYLEEAPFAATALKGLRAHPTVVIGFFANKGVHVREDLPALLTAESESRRQTGVGEDGPIVRFHGSVTDDPATIQIIMDHAQGAP
jgi:sirohydrochlorin cobaltochelatase